MNNKFKDLGLKEGVVESIEALNYTTPSPIQEQIIPIILNNKDLIGLAKTGTGKTLAYASTILSKIEKDGTIKAIVLVPTRELAMQVCKEFRSLNKDKSFNTIAVYGGTSISKQIEDLKNHPDILVGTAGRVLDLIKRGKVKLNNVDFFVLDEADEMLNMGFIEDIKAILNGANNQKQVLMLSATMSKDIESLAANYMKKDYEIVEIESDSKTADTVKQYYALINEKDRTEALCRFLDIKNSNKTIIFCRTRRECDELLKDILGRGYNAEVMHGDISQDMRMKTLDRFKKGVVNFLIATDVAARGIHVSDVEVVINYKLPDEEELYVHRIGRTGRAGEKGVAITLVTPKELKYLNTISKYTNSPIAEIKIPNTKDIISSKYDVIYKQIQEEQAKGIDESAINYVRDLNKGELMNFTAAILQLMVNKELGSNLNKNLSEAKERTRQKSRTSKDSTRVFITIGKKDGLRKRELLEFINKETKLNESNFNNIEVLDTYSFVDAKTTIVDKLIEKIYNKKYNNRIVRIEKAKKAK